MDASLATFEENDTSCCYALLDKVWVHTGKEPWEVYVVKTDADQLGKSSVGGGEQTANAEPVTAGAAGCACGS